MPSPTTDARLDRIGKTQLGLVAKSQARAAGISDHQVRTRRERGSLVRVQPGVYRTAGAKETWHQQVLAACLAAGPAAVGSHRAAAVVWYLADPPVPVDITVGPGRTPFVRGAVVHRSTDLRPVDVVRRAGVPVTNPIRTVGDLGAVAPELVEQAVERGLHARLFTTAALWRLVADLSRPGRRGLGVLREVLERRALGDARPESLLEAAFATVVAATGIDIVYQHPVVVAGRRYVLDFAVPEVKVCVEVDGLAVHGTRAALDHDLARQNALVLAGWHVLRYTSTHLRRRRAAIRDELTDLVAARRLPHPGADGVVRPDGPAGRRPTRRSAHRASQPSPEAERPPGHTAWPSRADHTTPRVPVGPPDHAPPRAANLRSTLTGPAGPPGRPAP